MVRTDWDSTDFCFLVPILRTMLDITYQLRSLPLSACSCYEDSCLANSHIMRTAVVTSWSCNHVAHQLWQSLMGGAVVTVISRVGVGICYNCKLSGNQSGKHFKILSWLQSDRIPSYSQCIVTIDKPACDRQNVSATVSQKHICNSFRYWKWKESSLSLLRPEWQWCCTATCSQCQAVCCKEKLLPQANYYMWLFLHKCLKLWILPGRSTWLCWCVPNVK